MGGGALATFTPCYEWSCLNQYGKVIVKDAIYTTNAAVIFAETIQDTGVKVLIKWSDTSSSKKKLAPLVYQKIFTFITPMFADTWFEGGGQCGENYNQQRNLLLKLPDKCS